MAYEIHYKFKNRDVTSVAVHPGFVATNLGRGGTTFNRLSYNIAATILGKTVFQGAQTTIYAAIADDVKGGKYYGDCKEEKSSPASCNIGTAADVWELSVVEVTKRLPGYERPIL
jgi:hypothetical protein